MKDLIDPKLLAWLRCPVSGEPLHVSADKLMTKDGHTYDVVEGIPCLIPATMEPTHSGYADAMAKEADRKFSIDVDSFMDRMLVPTCGNLFHGVKLRGRYPIPDMPKELPEGLVLDVGCNWGRWSIGASSAKRRLIGIDVEIETMLVAQALARKLTPDNMPFFVQGDARNPPFVSGIFDGVISYSVLQHFSRANATLALDQLNRVMKPGATAVIQMPNKAGLKARLTVARRGGDVEGSAFDVRYYSIDDLIGFFERHIGPARWRVDCFFGLNVHARDREFVQPSKRWIVDLATYLLKASEKSPTVARYSDSVFISATKPLAARGKDEPAVAEPAPEPALSIATR